MMPAGAAPHACCGVPAAAPQLAVPAQPPAVMHARFQPSTLVHDTNATHNHVEQEAHWRQSRQHIDHLTALCTAPAHGHGSGANAQRRAAPAGVLRAPQRCCTGASPAPACPDLLQPTAIKSALNAFSPFSRSCLRRCCSLQPPAGEEPHDHDIQRMAHHNALARQEIGLTGQTCLNYTQLIPFDASYRQERCQMGQKMRTQSPQSKALFASGQRAAMGSGVVQGLQLWSPPC